MLSDSDREAGDLHTLTLNDHYSKAFQYRKEREELAKLEEKYGSDASDMSNEEDSEDSEDTSEDSDGAELTPAVDAAILRTLARIRKKDPEIYNGDRQVFEEEQTRTKDRAPLVKTKAKDKSKPLTIRQAALSAALEDGHASSRSPSPQPLTHIDEQSLLQSETRAAFHGAVDSLNNGDEDDEDDLLVPRSRTRDEVELEEEEYKTFLEREVGEELRQLVTVDQDGGVDSAPAHGIGKDERKKKKAAKVAETSERKGQTRPKEDEDHEFLIDYIFNRGWIDRTKQRIPTYDEIVDSSKPSRRKKSKLRDHGGSDSEERSDEMEGEIGPTLSDEEDFDDLVDAFETSYNFRFEEPGGALIATHPRSIASVRREATTRKEARQRKKERKEAEKRDLLATRKEEIRRERKVIQQRVSRLREGDELSGDDDENSRKEEKNAELARLKDLKAKELGRKLERVTAEGGLSAISEEALANLDFDSPWDPDRHDAQMAALYGADIDLGDLEKPAWDDDINVDDIVPSESKSSKEELQKLKKKDKKKKKKEEDRLEEDGIDVNAMDADAEEAGWELAEDEEWDGTEEMRKRKVEKYMDEVVNRLGFNDITAHMPTRFHYIQTVPEDYGLTPADILLATDAELNAYAGLKKIAPYRNSGKPGKGKSWDPNRNERLKEFREKLRLRVGGGEGDWSIGGVSNRRRAGGSEGGGERKKRLGKKERAKMKASAAEDTGEAAQMNQVLSKKRNLESPTTNGQDVEVPTTVEETSQENGAPKKKRRRQHKKGAK
ncbi:hypothetical protein SCLCIDRAFT_1213853 [Scleroderma citrinum Foug A]|uniref:Kri1-like C-terminal domain-containing protein n=1 Tax=Scleroderma citrinum Foug A TaxID=1036808 RepID=A0A0C3AGI7_9AGAM|nr:hypothetical protein SCLCIDRAFT_1213853 [Scleroderma citrinum Foug A]